ncbi:MAG: hypothetical protein EA380_00555 [Phycisphaeraceae bacterium]|nr:MAG: hypothetical protein EA380_00555 [Phycisphaeraceae bacterium]
MELLLSLLGLGLIVYAIVMVIVDRAWGWLAYALVGLIVIGLRAVLSVALDIRDHLERSPGHAEGVDPKDDHAARP